ncbi:hypothetical protein MMC07_002486 [Pseudocyphellaria aurata]|nr:hypothetical protein [Pseudocyphellaria aurata]
MADITAGFPFLKLPLEVRNMVYKELLVKRKPIRMRRPKERPQSEPAVLGAFTVSKQIHQEAMSIYFGCNIFSAGGLIILAKFLHNIGPNACNAIRAVSIQYHSKNEYSEHNEIGFERLAQCGSLRKIRLLIGSFYRWNKNPDPGKYVPILKRPGIQSLLKTRGIEELDVKVKFRPSERTCPPEVFEKDRESFMQALLIVKEPRNIPEGRLGLRTEHGSGKKEGKKKKKKKTQSKPPPLPTPAEITSEEVLVQGPDNDLG